MNDEGKVLVVLDVTKKIDPILTTVTCKIPSQSPLVSDTKVKVKVDLECNYLATWVQAVIDTSNPAATSSFNQAAGTVTWAIDLKKLLKGPDETCYDKLGDSANRKLLIEVIDAESTKVFKPVTAAMPSVLNGSVLLTMDVSKPMPTKHLKLEFSRENTDVKKTSAKFSVQV